MWGLFKEVFVVYRGKFIKRRKKLGWKKNLHLMVFALAVVVLVIFVVKMAVR